MIPAIPSETSLDAADIFARSSMPFAFDLQDKDTQMAINKLMDMLSMSEVIDRSKSGGVNFLTYNNGSHPINGRTENQTLPLSNRTKTGRLVREPEQQTAARQCNAPDKASLFTSTINESRGIRMAGNEVENHTVNDNQNRAPKWYTGFELLNHDIEMTIDEELAAAVRDAKLGTNYRTRPSCANCKCPADMHKLKATPDGKIFRPCKGCKQCGQYVKESLT